VVGERENGSDDIVRRVVETGSGVMGAAIGAAVAGPFGLIAGAALPGVVGAGVDVLLSRRAVHRRGMVKEMLRLSVEASELGADEFVASVERDLATERLTSAAIEAAAESSCAERLQAIARSLAAGLTAQGRSEVDHQLLTIEALRDLEPVHVWLLDRVVQWEPLTGGILDGTTDPYGESASVGVDGPKPGSGLRTAWTRPLLDLNFARHHPAALFDATYGTLFRHGLIAEEGVARVLQALAERFENDRRISRLPDLNVTVSETLFGRELHRALVDAQAIYEVDPGELDIDPERRGFRNLRLSAKLEKYSEHLRIRKSDARAYDAQRGTHEEQRLSFYHIVTMPDEDLDY
jgi:hypothetical protein